MRAAGRRETLKVETERHAFAYVFEGTGAFRAASEPHGVLVEKQVDGQESVVREKAGDRSLVLFDSGDEVTVQAATKASGFCWCPANRLKSRWPGAGRSS